MTKLCLLSIWIGNLPETFELWKHSVLHNPTVDFYVITDNKNLKDEANLRFISMPFSEVRKRFQSLFDLKLRWKRHTNYVTISLYGEKPFGKSQKTMSSGDTWIWI